MFNIFQRSQSRYPTIRQALVQAGVSTAADPAQVGVAEMQGQFSGRRVNFFRAYQPGLNHQARAFNDLDAHPDLLLGSGHVEHGGMVVLDSPHHPEGAAPARSLADRAAHPDDAHLVFWDAEAAEAAETTLSAPAATWMQARSNQD